MKRKKNLLRIICALLCAVMMLPLAGCGETKESSQILFAMDTTMTLVAYGKNRDAGLAAAESVTVPISSKRQNLIVNRTNHHGSLTI